MKLKHEIRSRILRLFDLVTGLPRAAFWYQPTAAGVSVTEESALRATAVFACVRVLAWTLASLPLPVYRRLTPRGKERAPEHWLYRLLHDRPNKEMTSFTWRSISMAHLALWGNAYSEIEFDQFGQVVALWPMPPWRVEPRRTKGGDLFYEVRLSDGTTRNLADYQVLHVKGLGIDGLKGLSPIGQARQAVGLALAAEETGARLFGQGLNVGGVVEHPGKLSDQAHQNLRKSIEEKHQGLGKSHRLMLLEEGMKYVRAGIPPNEAQFLETRKFQIGDIARLFGVPPHMVGDLEKATFSNIEHQDIGFVKHTMRPWFVNWEQEIRLKLIDEPDYYAEFLVDGLLRGDVASRYQAYAIGRQWGWLCADDVRELENMNPLPDGQGEIYLVPMNMVPAGNIEDLFEASSKDAGSAQGDAGSAQDDDDEQEENSLPRLVETRQLETRSGKARARIAKSYRRVFDAAAARIIKREEADVMRQAKKMFAERSRSAFLDWLEGFYREHGEYVRKQILPPVMALAEAIQAETAGELDTDEGMTPELEDFVRKYADAYITRHTERSHGQLKMVLADAFDAGEDEIKALQKRFDEWGETRPGKIAREETVRVNGAVLSFLVGLAGFSRLVWRAAGADTCPFCQQLGGKTVGVGQDFIPAGDSLEADDGSKMRVYGPKAHPPIHDGCECYLEAQK